MDKLIAFMVAYVVVLVLARYFGYKDGHREGYEKGKNEMIDVIQRHMQENYQLVREGEKWKIMQK